MIELRCDSYTYRAGYSGKCQNLLLCYGDDLRGTLEVKCARCKQVKRYVISVVESGRVSSHAS